MQLQRKTYQTENWSLNIRLTGVKTSGSITLNKYELEQIDKTREEILSLGSQEALIQNESEKGNLTQKYLKD